MILCIWRGHLCTGCICLSRQFTLQTMSRQNLKTWRVQLTLGKEGHRKGIAIRNLWFTNQKLWSPCYISHKFEWFPFRHQGRDVFSLHFDDFEDVEKVKLSVQRLAALLQVVKNEFMNLLHSFCKIHNVIFRNVFLQAFAKLRKCCSCYKLVQLMAFFYSFGNMVEDFSFPFFPKSFKSTLILSDQSWLSSGCFAWNTRRDEAGKMQDTKMKRCKGAKMPNFPGAECTH